MITIVENPNALIEAEKHFIIIGNYNEESINKIIPIKQVSVKQIDESPVTHMQDSLANLILIPYHAKVKIDEELMGVWELLIKIRITEGKGQQAHICVIGNFPLEMVLRLEERAILLASKGISYLRLPEQLTYEAIQEKIKDKAKSENTRSFITKLIDIRRMRHAYANLWGLDRLIRVHKKYFPDFKNPNEEEGYPEKYKLLISSLDYNMAKYVYQPNNVSEEILKDTKGLLKSLKSLFVKRDNNARKKIRVLFIDDNADAGWMTLIRSLLNDYYEKERYGVEYIDVSVIAMTIGEYEVDDLYDKFKIEFDNGGIDVVISDLRLYPIEEQMYDYAKFKSIELFKRICEETDERGNNKYKKTRYMFMTASNQLNNFRNAMGTYSVDAIYNKEGFDYTVNAEQCEDNYKHLIRSLYSLINANYKRAAYRVGGVMTPVKEMEIIEKFDDYIQSEDCRVCHDQIAKEFNEYSHVIFDTNVYYSNVEPYIAWCNSDKIYCFYPVYKEIERVYKMRELSFRRQMADHFYNKYKSEKLLILGLSDKDIMCIDKRFEDDKGLKDLADKYFPQTIKILSRSNKNKILFITNDAGAKARVSSVKKKYYLKNLDIKTLWEYPLYLKNEEALSSRDGEDIKAVVECKISKNGKAYKVCFDDQTYLFIERCMISPELDSISIFREKILLKKYEGNCKYVRREILKELHV
jgi:hypothetical protein